MKEKPYCVPAGYEIQRLQCCATCLFHEEITDQWGTVYACEILGETENSDYSATAVNPLGICPAYKIDNGKDD